MLSKCKVNIWTHGSISWLIFNLVLIFVNFFNLVPIFVIFVQFSPNFVSIQNDQIYFLYNCYIEKFIYIKIHIYFKYLFYYFYTNVAIFLKGNYYICFIVGTCKK